MNDTLTARDQALADVFTTALEGGIGYWSWASEYRWSDEDGNPVRDFRAEILEGGDEEYGEDLPKHVIDRKVISRGIEALYQHMHSLHANGNANEYQWAAARDLRFGRYDLLDYDADTADMIVQFGLFDEIRYG